MELKSFFMKPKDWSMIEKQGNRVHLITVIPKALWDMFVTWIFITQPT